MYVGRDRGIVQSYAAMMAPGATFDMAVAAAAWEVADRNPAVRAELLRINAAVEATMTEMPEMRKVSEWLREAHRRYAAGN